MSKKYYTILERNAGESWAIAWGDYDRDTVKEEMADLKQSYNRAQHYKIIITGDTQAEINAAVEHENKLIADKSFAEFAEVKTQERCLKAAVKAFDLDRYANGCEMVRCEIEADLVAIVYPDLSRIAGNYNSAQYEYAALFCDQKMDLVAELFADRIESERAAKRDSWKVKRITHGGWVVDTGREIFTSPSLRKALKRAHQ